jgi:hypothetical protein
VRPASLPAGLPANVMPGVAVPPVGPWDGGSPPSRPGAPSSQPAVLCSAQTATGPSRGRAVRPLLPRYLGARLWLGVPWSRTAHVRGGRRLTPPGVGTATVGPPPPEATQGDQVALPSTRGTPGPACAALRPRWCPAHSPWRRQGGCLPGTAPRRLALAPACGLSCGPPLYLWRGSLTRPASSFPPAAYAHAWGCTWSALLTCWLGCGQGGFAPCRAHPLGHNNPWHRMAPHAKVSGLPWHEERVVRSSQCPECSSWPE